MVQEEWRFPTLADLMGAISCDKAGGLCWPWTGTFTFTFVLLADRVAPLWAGPKHTEGRAKFHFDLLLFDVCSGWGKWWHKYRTMGICPGSLLLEHPQPAAPRVSVCINQCNYKCVFSGEPLLCALPDLKKFPKIMSQYQLQRNSGEQRLDQALSVNSESWDSTLLFLEFSFFSGKKKKKQNLPRFSRFDLMNII